MQDTAISVLKGEKIFSMFPKLLDFSLLPPLFLRIALAFVLINWGRDDFKKPGILRAFHITFGALKILVGIMLGVGFYTQPAALVALLFTLVKFIGDRGSDRAKHFYGYYLLVFAVGLSLLFLGSGILAFDLPL